MTLDTCDILPRENLTDSPPSEFNLSDGEDGEADEEEEEEDGLVNFVANTCEDIIKPLPIRNGSDKHLIDAFFQTILRILEIKCNDPKVELSLTSFASSRVHIIFRLLFSIIKQILNWIEFFVLIFVLYYVQFLKMVYGNIQVHCFHAK